MSRFAKHGRRFTGKRAFGCRFGQTRAAAGALALAVPLALSLAPAASAQSGSGIYINNNVLDSLGPGPAATPGAPLAPAAPSARPVAPLAPLAPRPQGGNGTLTFQIYGSGNYVVTRPSTLLFPPLEAPTSTLAPGFTDNQAARTEAMNNAFAAGPEPSSQLLISPGSEEAVTDSVAIYMDNLPPADPGVAQGTAPVLTLRRPPLPAPAPAPRKPEVRAEMLAETGATAIDETTAALAPEFQAPEPAAPPEMADVSEPAEVEEAPLAALARAERQTATAPDPAELAQAQPETAEPEPAEPEPAELAEMAPAPPAPAQPEVARVEPEPAAPTSSEPPVAKAEAPAANEPAVATDRVAAQQEPTPARGADVAAATASDPAGAPVSLLPADSGGARTDSPEPDSPEPAGAEPASRQTANPVGSADVPAPTMQTASLPPSDAAHAAATPAANAANLTASGAVADMSLVFATDSAELSAVVQNELRSLAHVMRARDDGRIQVLGFASAESGSQDLARKLALSRALKVRTFLIDAGVPSTRIQVRSLGAQSDGGPANRVDIRPIDS